jgi:hypothetical protein
MARQCYRITFAPDGSNGAFLVEVEDVPDRKAPERPAQNAQKEARAADSDPMTENQRRFLFRLLAGQGIDGKQAEAHLRDYFRVKSLGEISKVQASQYIDQLVRDQKENGK